MSQSDHPRRREGGQPGNQNARKHGYYSRLISDSALASLDQAREINGLDEEIALLRVRLRSVLQKDPDNLRLIIEALSALGRLVRTRQKLGFRKAADFDHSLLNVLLETGLSAGLTKDQIVTAYFDRVVLS